MVAIEAASWRGDTVTPIATATNTPGPPIQVGEGARAIVITPDGKTAYVVVWREPGMVVAEPIDAGSERQPPGCPAAPGADHQLRRAASSDR